MAALCAARDLIRHFGGQEVVELAFPGGRDTWLGESATAAELPSDWPGAGAGSVALVLDTGAFHRHDGSAWVEAGAGRLAEQIAAISAEVESALAARYVVPPATVPDDLRAYVADLIRFRLYDDEVPEAVESRYRQAQKWLEQVASGARAIAGLEPLGGDGRYASGGRSMVFTDALIDTMPGSP